MPNYWWNSFERYNLKSVYWCIKPGIKTKLFERGLSRGLGIGVNYAWCFLVVVIFMLIGRTKWCRDFKPIIWLVKVGMWGNFYGIQLSHLDIVVTVFSLAFALLLIDCDNHLFLTCTYSRQFQTFCSILLKILQVLLKVLHKMLINYFATLRQ